MNMDLREEAIKLKNKFFNDDDFLNIDELTFKWSNRMTHSYGNYKPYKKEISISTCLLADPSEVLTTLCHELVHAYQHMKYGGNKSWMVF